MRSSAGRSYAVRSSAVSGKRGGARVGGGAAPARRGPMRPWERKASHIASREERAWRAPSRGGPLSRRCGAHAGRVLPEACAFQGGGMDRVAAARARSGKIVRLTFGPSFGSRAGAVVCGVVGRRDACPFGALSMPWPMPAEQGASDAGAKGFGSGKRMGGVSRVLPQSFG